MTETKLLPNSIPPVSAEFQKPYMEFEYSGEIYRMENLKGGHNGKNPENNDVIAACNNDPPLWDEEKERWVIPITNNMINIEIGSQNDALRAFSIDSPLRAMTIINNPRHSYQSRGYLISAPSSRQESPRFPVDCIFNMFIRVRVPGKGTLINTKPFQLTANGLTDWPPTAGTTYTHNDTVELFPEWFRFGRQLWEPMAKILAGDETIITEINEVNEEQLNNNTRGLRFRMEWLINRIT